MQQTKQLNVKVVPELMEEINIISQVLHIDRNEWVRNILAHEAKKELEEHKAFIALEYAKGMISQKQLMKALGKKDADDIEHIVKTTKKGMAAAKQWGKKLRA